MPAYSWGIAFGTNAMLGMDAVQSGRYLYVTISKRRNTSGARYEWHNASITVTVNGTTLGGVSVSNDFTTSMSLGAWYNAALVNAQFDLGYGVSTANITVTWSYPTDGWAGGSTGFSKPVTPFYNAPAAPTDLTAVRVSDTSANLSWTRNATSTAPYTSQVVLRSENGGTPIEVATLSGTATSYVATTAPNRKYVFTVQARNSAGSTSSAASSTLLTTPAALASLSGAKVSGGIKLTFSKLDVPYTEAQVVLEITTNGGSSWSEVETFDAADLSTSSPTEWTDTDAPTGGTVQYRATVKTNGGTQGVLSASATLSNVMVLNVPPLAPTNLLPSGLVDVASPLVLSWSHTPSADGAAQSSRQIQYSTDSGATQTDIVAGDSTVSTYTWNVDTDAFDPGQTIQWRVRTAGSQPGTYGAWSAWQTITLRSSLTVTVTSPSGTWEGGDIPVGWSVAASWGSASQVAYRVTMSDGAVVVYDSGTVVSTAETALIPAAVQRNLTSYTITVTVTDNYGLTSLADTTLIDTDFLAPGPVGLSWVYDDDLGQLVLTPEFSEETSSELDDTVSWMLERSLDGATWREIGTFFGSDPVPDAQVRVGADSWYRTTGYTELDVAGEQTVYVVARADVQSRWARLAYGDAYESQVRFGWSQTVEVSSGRAADSFEIEGVDYPAAVFGRQLYEKFAVTGKLLYKSSIGSGGIADRLTTSSADEFREMAKQAAVCLFRDGRGEYFTGRVSDVKVTPKGATRTGQPDEAGVSFTIERVTL